MKTLIRGGRVVTAVDDYIADVLVDGEKVALIGQQLDARADKTIDAAGRYVLPGGIDVHTHLELPFGGTFAFTRWIGRFHAMSALWRSQTWDR